MDKTKNEIAAALAAEFPAECIEQKDGGSGRTYDYVSGDVVIRRLNRATDNCWDMRITNQEWRDLPVKRGGMTLCSIVSVEITIPGLGTRAGTGVQEVQDGAGADAMVKGALTDALKVAAKQFGVALDLYGPDLEGQFQVKMVNGLSADIRKAVAGGADNGVFLEWVKGKTQSGKLATITRAEANKLDRFIADTMADLGKAKPAPQTMRAAGAERTKGFAAHAAPATATVDPAVYEAPGNPDEADDPFLDE